MASCLPSLQYVVPGQLLMLLTQRPTAAPSAMLSSSQELNPSYGYLWWLNKPGTSSYLYTRYAPETMVTAAGLNGQFINVLPDSGIVVVRMGDAPVNNTDISDFHDEMWRLLSGLIGN